MPVHAGACALPSVGAGRLNSASRGGYTYGMKTAISISDDLFKKGERLARRMKTTRSELYGKALADYVARHGLDDVTEAMNQAYAELGMEVDAFVEAASRRVLERSEW